MTCPAWCTHDHGRFSAEVHSMHVYRDEVASVSISQFDSPYLAPDAHISIIRQNLDAPSGEGYLPVRPRNAATLAGLVEELGRAELAAAIRKAAALLADSAEGPDQA
jgi:hypothetical protein